MGGGSKGNLAPRGALGYNASMNIIAHLHTDLPTKFGVPRQSGLVDSLKSRLVFTPEFRDPEALRGLAEFSHIWLIWEFSQAKRDSWSPTVRPPRLGGNKRLGVFATRSPFRPNALGLSCVRLERVDLHTPEGPVLYLAGADLMDGTPIYDIKPYIPYADCHPEASGGFTSPLEDAPLDVDFPASLRTPFTEEQQKAVIGILERDPRPHYHDDEQRVYGMAFGGYDVRFRVIGNTAVVCDVLRRGE